MISGFDGFDGFDGLITFTSWDFIYKPHFSSCNGII